MFLLIFVLFFLLRAGAASADSELPKYIIDQLHGDIRYTIITERNLNEIDKVPAGFANKHFIVLQAKPESLTQEDADKILSWVRAGGVMWFYDSRLAHFFGMKNAPYSKKMSRGQDHKGGFGSGQVDGINVIAGVDPFAEHPVATGLQSIQAFLVKVGDDQYSGVASNTAGVIPIFLVNPEKKCVVALRKEGRGWVIFKPLVWPKVLGGERFQANLKEFSAGYPVPKAEKNIVPPDFEKGKPVKLTRMDSLILSNGDQLLGEVMDKKFTFMGGDGRVQSEVDKIDYFNISPLGDKVKLRDGKEYSGTLMTLRIKLKSRTGKKIEVEKENIHSIKFDVGEKGK